MPHQENKVFFREIPISVPEDPILYSPSDYIHHELGVGDVGVGCVGGRCEFASFMIVETPMGLDWMFRNTAQMTEAELQWTIAFIPVLESVAHKLRDSASRKNACIRACWGLKLAKQTF